MSERWKHNWQTRKSSPEIISFSYTPVRAVRQLPFSPLTPNPALFVSPPSYAACWLQYPRRDILMKTVLPWSRYFTLGPIRSPLAESSYFFSVQRNIWECGIWHSINPHSDGLVPFFRRSTYSSRLGPKHMRNYYKCISNSIEIQNKKAIGRLCRMRNTKWISGQCRRPINSMETGTDKWTSSVKNING